MAESGDALDVTRARREAARTKWREAADVADAAEAEFWRLDMEVERLVEARRREAEQGG